jgi:hypothetical protein
MLIYFYFFHQKVLVLNHLPLKNNFDHTSRNRLHALGLGRGTNWIGARTGSSAPARLPRSTRKQLIVAICSDTHARQHADAGSRESPAGYPTNGSIMDGSWISFNFSSAPTNQLDSHLSSSVRARSAPC